MSNSLSTEVKEMMCILTFSGIKFYFFKKDFKQVALAVNTSKFITIENNLINTSDIAGIYEEDYILDKEKQENRKLKIEEDKNKFKKLNY